MKTKRNFINCMIRRRMEVTRGTWNLATGVRTVDSVNVEVRTCDAPLFSGIETTTGVCRSCASGFETPGNEFESPAEKTLATESHLAYKKEQETTE